MAGYTATKRALYQQEYDATVNVNREWNDALTEPYGALQKSFEEINRDIANDVEISATHKLERLKDLKLKADKVNEAARTFFLNAFRLRYAADIKHVQKLSGEIFSLANYAPLYLANPSSTDLVQVLARIEIRMHRMELIFSNMAGAFERDAKDLSERIAETMNHPE